MVLGLWILALSQLWGACPTDVAYEATRSAAMRGIERMPQAERASAYLKWLSEHPQPTESHSAQKKGNTILKHGAVAQGEFTLQEGRGEIQGLVFTVENIVFSEMQDHLFSNHQGATDISLLFHHYVVRALQRRPEVWRKLRTDVFHRQTKTMTLVFEDQPSLAGPLVDAFAEAQISYAHDLWMLGLLEGEKIRGLSGAVAQPTQWFVAGLGKTPVHSYLNARATRALLGKTQSTLVGHTDPNLKSGVDVRGSREQAWSRLLAARQSLPKEFPDMPSGLFERGAGPDRVLSLRVLRILRKVRADGLDEYIAAVQESLRPMAPAVTRNQVLALRDYYRAVSDYWMPGFYVEHYLPLESKPRAHGVIEFDLEGLGASNVHEIMKELVDPSVQTPEDAVRAAQKGVRAVSGQLGTTLDRLAEHALKFNASMHPIADEGRIVPMERLSVAQVRGFYRTILKDEHLNTRGIRLTYLAPNDLPVVQAEAVVKEIQQFQRAAKLGIEALAWPEGVRKRMSQIMLPVIIEVMPPQGRIKVNVMLPSWLSKDAQQWSQAQTAIRQAWGLGRSGILEIDSLGTE